MNQAEAPIPLNDPQRLRFEVTLASLEAALARLEQIAVGATPGVLGNLLCYNSLPRNKSRQIYRLNVPG